MEWPCAVSLSNREPRPLYDGGASNKMGSQLKGEYYTITLTNDILEDVSEEELYDVCKNISYVPKAIIKYARERGIE